MIKFTIVLWHKPLWLLRIFSVIQKFSLIANIFGLGSYTYDIFEYFQYNYVAEGTMQKFSLNLYKTQYIVKPDICYYDHNIVLWALQKPSMFAYLHIFTKTAVKS